MIGSKAVEKVLPAVRDAAVPGSFALVDAAAAAWLWHALQRYTGAAGPLWPSILAPAAAAPLLSLAFALGRPRPGAPLALLLKAVGFGAALAALGALAGARAWLPLTAGQALWLGCANAALAWLQRAVYLGAWRSPPAQPGEALRWLALGAAATLVMLPFYYSGSIGAGDAHWYAIMLADFLAQLRAGVFPVWVGQSLDAFNGAVSPLRYAPGFQYFGGCVDLLTAHALEPMAVRNACLAVAAILGAFSAYACLRPVASRRPWLACGLALLWIAGPGVWAPAVSGDQYMTFLSIPFVPLVLHGCWRLWERDDRWSRLWIAAGLAGTWLFHSPVALWMTLISAGIYLPTVIFRRPWRRQLGLAALTGALFVILGMFPFASVLTLDDQIKLIAGRGYTLEMLRTFFPANFEPIDPKALPLTDYQLGYALLAVLAASLALLRAARRRGAGAFAAAALVIPLFVVPVPGVTAILWGWTPQWFMDVQNVWPMQRLFLVWSSLVAFLGAIVLGSPRIAAARWQRAALVGAFLCAGAWSGREAWKILSRLGRIPPEDTRISLSDDNLLLTRYAYSSFAYAPGYFSHAYMEPWLENRLLDRHTLDPILRNADAAAPPPYDPQSAGPRLVQSGLLTAESINGSKFYSLVPRMLLNPGTHYALRLEFLRPGEPGTLQVLHPSMFREYTLPDSGIGINRAAPFLPSFAFGSEASNSHVLPMVISGPGPAAPDAIFIANKRTDPSYPFARFWLYTYDRAKLPIAVTSWIPYRARVQAPAPCYLETPRMWVTGWRASINGRPAPVLRSRENLVMIAVEAGSSDVRLEYSPTFVLGAAFWMCAAGWLGLGAAGLGQLAFWSAGSRLPFGWTHRLADAVARAPAGALGRPLGFARRRPGLSAASALIILTAALAALPWLLRPRDAFRKEAGPVKIDFVRPYRQLGTSQPLLSTGRPHAGTIVFIRFVDSRRVRFGADVWGELYESEPVDMDYNQVQSLVVSDSALFPPGHPALRALRDFETKALRGELRVELNGRTLIRQACYAYETSPSEIHVGGTRIGSLTEKAFAGEIVGVERLAIPRTLALPNGEHAHLRVRFPRHRAAGTEPLLAVATSADARLYCVTYLPHRRLRLDCSLPDGACMRSPELKYDPEGEHDLDFVPGDAADGSRGFEVACYLDDVHVLGKEVVASTAAPPVATSGVNSTGSPGVLARFTGPELELSAVSNTAQPLRADTEGAEHLVVLMPADKHGRREPLLSTGRTGAGDFVYAIYEDPAHVRIGYDHWGSRGAISAPVALDYRMPHEVWISSGALFPPDADTAFWRDIAPALRQRLRTTVTVVLDGQVVLTSATTAYPSSSAEVAVGRNPIGASTCDPEFSGIVEFAERAGSTLPPALR